MAPQQEGHDVAGQALALLDPRDAFLLEVREAAFDGGAGSVELVLRGENGKKERDRDRVDLRPINGRAGRSLHDYSLMA
jgi:hypothetical protein